MAYTVIARRWRPQSLDEVVGQRHVTQTLRNAFGSGRVAQAFVFAGPRGVGKTTTARILARMLNCDHGPTADPCGQCDPCREIAEGRDMDVLEIDAATHTGIDNIREVIITGLAIRPARDRYKVFIIDEVHQLSNPSFNALLKSIEEPPPHVAFVMATTALDKIPDTIVSRSQVFEFKTISSRAIAEQLQKIADADGLQATPEAIALVARAAEGSMRDAQTAFDQVISFAGRAVGVDDVATVLGLVGRDLLFDVMTAVADENGPASFELAGRAVEAGYDLKLLCRELSRLVRDLLVLKVDPGRMQDAEIAPEGDRSKLQTLLPRFSQEDLLRAFDLLSKAEFDIRSAAEPRHQLEMALLRWIHLRKLTPLTALLDQLKGLPTPPAPQSPGRLVPPSSRPAPGPAPHAAPSAAPGPSRPATASPGSSAAGATRVTPVVPVMAAGEFLPAYHEALRAEKPGIYGTTVGLARVTADGDRVVFGAREFLAKRLAADKAWLESTAQRVAGQRMVVAIETLDAAAAADDPASGRAADAAPRPSKDELIATARAHPAVQTVLEIFPADIKDATELT